MNGKPINIKRDGKLIRRYLNISKPFGVSNIEFDLEPTGDKGEYYMDITYIVPDGSEYLQQDMPIDFRQGYVNYRYNWNYHITKDIYNFFGLKVIINNSGTRSEKFNYGK
jgi:hypothetical protein